MSRRKNPVEAAMNPLPRADKSATPPATRGPLEAATERFTRLGSGIGATKETVKMTGQKALHMVETQTSLFAASLAEGYFGEDKLEVGGIDLRAPLGILANGFGLYDTLSGGNNGGEHALALGNGVLGSYVASAGRKAGERLSKRKATPPPAPNTPSLQGPLVTVPSLELPPEVPSPALLPAPRIPVTKLTPAPEVEGSTPIQGVERAVVWTPQAERQELPRESPPSRVAGPMRQDRVQRRRDEIRNRLPRAPQEDEGDE